MPKLNNYKVLAPEVDFLAFPDHYVNITGLIEVAVLATLATTDEAGKQVVKRGTVVHVDEDGKVTAASGNGNAIIFNSIEVAKYDEVDVAVTATLLVHGFVRRDRLTNAEDLKCELIHVVSK